MDWTWLLADRTPAPTRTPSATDPGFRPRIPALGLVRAVSRAGQKLNNLDEELE